MTSKLFGIAMVATAFVFAMPAREIPEFYAGSSAKPCEFATDRDYCPPKDGRTCSSTVLVCTGGPTKNMLTCEDAAGETATGCDGTNKNCKKATNAKADKGTPACT